MWKATRERIFDWIAQKVLDWLWLVLLPTGAVAVFAFIYSYVRGIQDYWIGLLVGAVSMAVFIFGHAMYATSRKPRPNLKFRRCHFGPGPIIGHTAYRAIMVEVGNDPQKGKNVIDSAYHIKAYITYFDDNGQVLYKECPALWTSMGRHVRILAGESDDVVVAFGVRGNRVQFTPSYPPDNRFLDGCKNLSIQLLDEKGKTLANMNLTFPLTDGELPQLLKEW